MKTKRVYISLFNTLQNQLKRFDSQLPAKSNISKFHMCFVSKYIQIYLYITHIDYIESLYIVKGIKITV